MYIICLYIRVSLPFLQNQCPCHLIRVVIYHFFLTICKLLRSRLYFVFNNKNKTLCNIKVLEPTSLQSTETDQHSFSPFAAVFALASPEPVAALFFFFFLLGLTPDERSFCKMYNMYENLLHVEFIMICHKILKILHRSYLKIFIFNFIF